MARTLAWPLRHTPGGRYSTVEQNTLGEVQQSVDMILTVPAGSLVYDPSFGRPELAFTSPRDLESVVEQVVTAEESGDPRAGDVAVTATGGAVRAVVGSVREVY